MMIETTILQHLNELHSHNLLSAECFMMRPENPPGKYVLLEKTGGSKSNQLCKATFAFQSYASTLYEAASLNEEVKEAVESLINLDAIASVHYQTDYNFTNAATKQPRYQAVFEITHY